ncbi:MAG: response regulator transcription factor [Campylobacterota bacterium]|nr:response regulator transcription factor [Campylobacterota bacterium]
MRYKILLLEDDVTLSQTVEEFLDENGYDVTSVYEGLEANEMMYEKSFDLFLLDVNVPNIDGFELLKQQRDNDVKTPAIFITSLNSVDSLEKGYKSGADDYIRKPFALKELLLRVETILKRGFFHDNDNSVKITQNIKYDTNTSILYVDEKPENLNLKESKLLKLFLQNSDRVLTHQKIYDTLWDYDETPSESSLRTYIKNIRKIIGKDKIVSIKKLGYKFT